jgi:hypothetical protein
MTISLRRLTNGWLSAKFPPIRSNPNSSDRWPSGRPQSRNGQDQRIVPNDQPDADRFSFSRISAPRLTTPSATALHFVLGAVLVQASLSGKSGLSTDHDFLLLCSTPFQRRGTMMFASIRKYKARRGSAQHLANRVRDDFIPLLRQMEGFRG